MNDYPAIEVTRKLGSESFHFGSHPIGFSLLQFWQWAASDLTGNALRGLLAEYIVATALNRASGVRTEWDAFDILSEKGRKVEVKSAAHIQSWEQKAPSAIRFNIRPTQRWNAATNEYSQEAKRQADVYVFAVLAHTDQQSVDPLNLGQWVFYVLRASKLNELGMQKSIALSRLRKLGPIEASYKQIAAAVESEAQNGS
ncbi:MAG: hypothetical protein V2J55_18320 [Candidatus Competibacteraceae bacterium]|jgi:hypothetical protein|nr:hypothetical protein [Candidatus Competibacteraceae bacterium]